MAVLSFRETLGGIAHVDHHAHGILRAQPGTVEEFRALFSLGDYAAANVPYQQAVRVLAEQLGCEPDEGALFERRKSTDPDMYAALLMGTAGAELVLVDEGYPPAELSTGWEEIGRLSGCPSRPILRIESTPDRVANARELGYIALKTIAAYRGGLDAPGPVVRAALETNEQSGDPLPVQVHTGFGDASLSLAKARPALLEPVIERHPSTNFVLLHCYPFVREAAWLAHVYPNVFIDLSLTMTHVWPPARPLAEALELGPVSKLLYGSDAVDTPELYLLAAIWWRDALAEVLPGDEAAARMILSENARSLYRLNRRAE